jgi:Family of unknown function (DUF6516)
MKAELLLKERLVLSSRAFVEIVIWQVPEPVSGSLHEFRYRLAYVVNGVCVLRYDNEAGKGDHKHDRETEVPYKFTDVETLQADFWAAVNARRKS